MVGKIIAEEVAEEITENAENSSFVTDGLPVMSAQHWLRSSFVPVCCSS